MLTVIQFFLLSAYSNLSILAQDNVRIMAYNIFEYASGTADTTTRNPHYRSIINNINPDILVGIEIEPRDNDNWAVGFLDKVLNGGSSNGDYSMGTYLAITNSNAKNDNNVIYYKHSEFTFLSSQIVAQDGNHPTLEFKLRHNNTFEEIIIYGVHFSSTNSNQRNDEAIDIRALTDNFTTEYFIAVGDFNFNFGPEDAYNTLLDQTNSGYFLDPASFAASFNTFNIRFSQSSFDERYDLILNSQSVVDAGGVEYVSSSFVVDGNDGYGNLNNIPAYYITASDHLPIYADFLFGNPTPVELAFFTGSLNGTNVLLRWRTETEINNFGFEIEKITPLSNPYQGGNDEVVGDWVRIGIVPGNGNTNSPKYYEFSDADIKNSGEYKYRLKQIDNDGTFEYSDVVTVTIGSPVLYSLSQNYPNPFNPETRIDYTLSEQQNVSLRVYNMLGELVQELVNEVKPAGTYTVTFNPISVGSGLPSGIYVYVLKTPAFVSNHKMTFLK